jgi:hypothetical protein
MRKTVNADDHPGLGLCYDIQSIPTLLYFINGLVKSAVGYERVGHLSGRAEMCALLMKLLFLAGGFALTIAPRPVGWQCDHFGVCACASCDGCSSVSHPPPSAL